MIIKRIFLPALLVLLFGVQVLAQDTAKTETPVQGSLFPARMIKFSPFALFELPQPSFQFSYEYGIGWPLSVQHEIGLLYDIPASALFENGDFTWGGKFKTEIRYYFDAGISQSYFPYVAFEGMYKLRKLTDARWYDMDEGLFSQWIEVDKFRQQFAFHVKYGQLVCISRSHNFYLDSYIGLGIRRYIFWNRYDTTGLLGDPNSLVNPSSYSLPSLTLGIKVGLGF